MKSMMLVVFVGSLVAFSGCEDSKEKAATAEASAAVVDDDDDDDDDAPEAAAEAEGDDELAELPEACRNYITSFEACFENMPATMPEAAKQAMKSGFEQQRKSFASATGAAREALVPGCQAALDALKQNPSCKI